MARPPVREKQRRRESAPHEPLLQKTLEQARALHKSVLELRQNFEQREKTFRDTQDGVAQKIYAIGLVLERARGHAGVDVHLIERTILRSIEQLNRVIREIREQVGRYS